MNSIAPLLPTIMFVTVVVGWIVFAAIFVFRKTPGTKEAEKRERASIIGIVFQAIAYALVWSWRRPSIAPAGDSGAITNILLEIIILLLLGGSIVLVTGAVKSLGKQWSLAAELVKEHQLILEGPYGIVRHPIYTGMMGMFMATGLAISDWWAIVAGLALFIVGTMIRIRIEERLLRKAFGRRYDDYAQRVPALLPVRRT